MKEILQAYQLWASNETKKRALIVYDSMWHSTESMALAIQDAFEDKAYSTNLLNLQHNHISDIMTQVIDAEYICLGSPTLNGRMLPTMASFLTYLSGLAPKNRKSIVFGSYGWGPKMIEDMSRMVEDAGIEVIAKEKIKYIPSESDLEKLKSNVSELI